MSAVIMIGYDLKDKPIQTYAPLIEEIQKLATDWWHCLDSTWLVTTSLDVEQVRNRLRTRMDATDELLVITVTAPAAWFFPEQCGDWLQRNLT
jgi:hypothetical protein